MIFLKTYNRIIASSKRVMLLFFCITFFSSSLWAQKHKRVETYYDLVLKNFKEVYYIDKETGLADSLYTTFYTNGHIKSEGYFIDGKATGLWKYYYDNGLLKMAGKFENHDHVGLWKFYYENGQESMEGELVKNVKQGYWKFYYENGAIKNLGNFKNDKKVGLWKYFNIDGSPKAECAFENDRGLYKEFYSSGKLKSTGTIENGKSTGVWNYYYENGQIKATGIEKEGLKDGAWKYYFENGNVASEGFYVNNKEVGNWKYYYENGVVKAEGNMEASQKEGYWKMFSTDGILTGEGNFKNGEGTYKEYYENGKLKLEGYIKNDRYEKLWKYYYETGLLEGDCFYNNGYGKYTGYYPDGSLKMEGHLRNGVKEGVWKLYKENGELAGYYQTYYNENETSFKLIDSAKVTIPKVDTVIVSDKSFVKLKKKKSRYFKPRINEFKGLIFSYAPLSYLTRTLPIYVEIYNQERIGYEFNATLKRIPFFRSNNFMPNLAIYQRGISASFRLKFYQPDHDRGMFWFGHEIKYARNNYALKIIDSTVSVESFPISKEENIFEYAFLIGDRFVTDSKSKGWTFDVFIGIGVGYRFMKNNWQTKEEYESYFQGLNQKNITIPFRLGFNVGYILNRKYTKKKTPKTIVK